MAHCVRPYPGCYPADLWPAGRRKPRGYRPILTIENAKTTKGEDMGYLTGIFYGAPANESGVMNTCTMATDACKAACLFTAGRGQFKEIKAARIAKTLLLFHDRPLFLACLRWDIRTVVRRAEKLGMIPAIRTNGTTDLAWLAELMADEFPHVQFYDYTKLPKPELRIRPNYSITFSYSGSNLEESLRLLNIGFNVAVVFDTRKGQELPAEWHGYPVIDGDLHDLRFLDPVRTVVGLRAKGLARKQESPFIVLA